MQKPIAYRQSLFAKKMIPYLSLDVPVHQITLLWNEYITEYRNWSLLLLLHKTTTLSDNQLHKQHI